MAKKKPCDFCEQDQQMTQEGSMGISCASSSTRITACWL